MSRVSGKLRIEASRVITRSRRSKGTAVSAFVLTAFVLATAGVAHAHPLVREGIRRYEEADFAGALDALARAEASKDLTRSDVVELLASKALVHFAMEQQGELQMDLTRLASLDPNYSLPSSVPPALRSAFQDARRKTKQQLKIDVIVRPSPGGIGFRAEVHNDPGNVVRSIRLSARTHGGQWRKATSDTLDMPAAVGVEVDYYAHAVGPGGAVIASAGSAVQPRTTTVPETALAASSDTGSDPLRDADKDKGGGPSVWLIVGAGAVAIAATVAVILLVKGGSSDETQFSVPMVVRNAQ